MSVNIVFNGLVYTVPQTGEDGWGEDVTSYLTAIPSGCLQKTGGTFTLTANANFGATYGLLSAYFSSRTASPSTSGLVRMAKTDTIGWKNTAGSGNLLLAIDSSDRLTFNGSVIQNAFTIGSLDAAAANATGLALTGTVLSTQSADATHPGMVNTSAQTLGSGVKTFSSAPIMSALSASQVVVTDSGKALASVAYASANTASAIVQRDGSGNFAAGTITASLTGVASGNTTITPAQYAVVVSGAANVLGTITPDASTAKVLISGGASANPAWALITNTNLSGSAAITNANLAAMASASTSAGTVKGNISGSSATPSDIALATANTVSSVVYRDGSGNFAAGTITATISGSSSGNLSYTPNQYGALFSGSANVVSVLAPDASTAKVLISGGASANPAWSLLTNTNLSGSAAITNANLAAMASSSTTVGTVKGNISGSSAVPSDIVLSSAATSSTAVYRDSSGNFAATTITAALTGTASGNTTISANQYGVVLSGSANVLSVLAPDASLTKVLKSGGASANPSWLAYDNSNTVSTLVFRDSSGNFAAGTITASLTGLASLNLSATANQYGVLLSGAANVAVVLAPNASTAYPLVSGGSSANPSWALLGVTGGGTGSATVVSAPAASAWAGWDANKNLSANNHIAAYATTVTAAATTTLVVGSARLQFFTGSTTQIVALPVTSTLVLGQQFQLVNNSSGAVTVNSSGGNAVQVMAAASVATITCILTSGTDAASWNVTYATASAGGGSVTSVAMTVPTALFATSPVSGSPVTSSGTLAPTLATQTAATFFAGPTSGSAATPTFRALQVPTIQRFTSSTGTYTTAAGTFYIRVRMVGGGGGGGGGGSSGYSGGGTGGNTTFGSSLLTCNGGAGGAGGSGNPGAGGTATIASGPTGIAIAGGQGQQTGIIGLMYNAGGNGAASPLGGEGAGQANTVGTAAATNSGSGGGGGGTNNASATCQGGGGGSAGGWIDTIITSPSATYAYAIGAAGSAGGGGSNGSNGAAGGSGYIEVTEYYQ